MNLAIMQPYFFPYIGYFQLINSVDTFVVYDNIKYTKKGWINRNRIIDSAGRESIITLPLKKDADSLNISQRMISNELSRDDFLNKIKEFYKKSPHFFSAYACIEQCIRYQNQNLFDFLFHSIQALCQYLKISTQLLPSSLVNIDHDKRAQDKVIAICKSLQASHYINAIGGVALYSQDEFKQTGLQLSFLKTHDWSYSQFGNSFRPWLSIIDVMMFNSVEEIKAFLDNGYELIKS